MGSRNYGSVGSGDCDVGLGLTVQAKESLTAPTHKRLMATPHHYEPQSSSSSRESNDGGGGGGGFGRGGRAGCGSGGPMFCNTSNRVACMGDIYDVVGAGDHDTGVGAAVVMSKSLQHPFPADSFTINSSGEMAPSVNMRVPFTAAQWQELERQTTIFKYIVASVPVPPYLLLPITKIQPNVPSFPSTMARGSLELGISSNNQDPEPWRCRRTDGKKWRCSRDAVPEQKYCERHAHKSRPRSRKPVELHINNIDDSNTTTKSYEKSLFLNQMDGHFSLFTGPNLSNTSGGQHTPRFLEWFTQGETAPVVTSSQEWQLLKRDAAKCNDKGCSEFQPEYMNLSGGHGLQAQGLNLQCNLLLNSSQAQAQESRQFIDAWSTAAEGDDIVGIGNKCCLTLSMSGASETNEEIENPQLGNFGITGLERENAGSWMGSPPGGPLAEALCLGITTASAHGYSNSSTTTDSSNSKN